VRDSNREPPAYKSEALLHDTEIERKSEGEERRGEERAVRKGKIETP
jgi:hypothetical protein